MLENSSRETTKWCEMKSAAIYQQIRVLLVVLLVGGMREGHGAMLYVSPEGDDQAVGSREAPLRSLVAARERVRPLLGKEEVSVTLLSGHYYLEQPFVLRAEDSGTREYPVVYRAEVEGQAIISGAKKVDLDWRKGPRKQMCAELSGEIEFDQLYIGGKQKNMARFPNLLGDEDGRLTLQRGRANALDAERIERWRRYDIGYLHAMHEARWGSLHYELSGLNEAGRVELQGGWQHNRRRNAHKIWRVVENVYEELDTEEEYYHDREAGVLYYYPQHRDGEMENLEHVELAQLESLIRLEGTLEAPVKHVRIEGVVLTQTKRTFMRTREPVLMSDWRICRDGAVYLTGVESVVLEDCRITKTGGNAVFIDGYGEGVQVKRCEISKVGASGVCFLGKVSAVRDAALNYEEQWPRVSDYTLGPKSKEYPSNCSVVDCQIRQVGLVEKQVAAVKMAIASFITVQDTLIQNAPRAGITIASGCWGGHLIRGCDISEVCLESQMHGSIYIVGRDRVMRIDQVANRKRDRAFREELPYLDACSPILIRENRIQCGNGWDVATSSYTNHIHIENNLLLGLGVKLPQGYGRKVRNNLMPNGYLSCTGIDSLHLDEVTHNVLQRVQLITDSNDRKELRVKMDQNLFLKKGEESVWREDYGLNLQSVYIDGGGFSWESEDIFQHKALKRIGLVAFSQRYGPRE